MPNMKDRKPDWPAFDRKMAQFVADAKAGKFDGPPYVDLPEGAPLTDDTTVVVGVKQKP